MKNTLKKARKGFSLVELLIAVVVLGILGAMLIAAGTSAQNKARVAVAQNDIDSARNAVYTAVMMNPNVAQFTDDTADWKQKVVDIINEELDETWQWDLIAAKDGASGPIAQTRTMRDPWKNPYTLYAYTDTYTTTYYRDEASGANINTPTDANKLVPADSSMTLVIVSAGPNGTGVGKGITGSIITEDDGSGTPASAASQMVNNTDGIDDIGVVMQVVNASTTQATFGWSSAGLGTLENVNWYFCGRAGEKGKTVEGVYSVVANGSAGDYAGPANGSSLKLHPTYEKLPDAARNATKTSPVKVDN